MIYYHWAREQWKCEVSVELSYPIYPPSSHIVAAHFSIIQDYAPQMRWILMPTLEFMEIFLHAKTLTLKFNRVKLNLWLNLFYN